ncbi:MAG: type 4b pilus protein PilO2 [Alphaproteobacteria bacterium]|nr:type 4b pilus protein PilO2 [Alphaproteobacteria bacterium]
MTGMKEGLEDLEDDVPGEGFASGRAAMDAFSLDNKVDDTLPPPTPAEPMPENSNFGSGPGSGFGNDGGSGGEPTGGLGVINIGGTAYAVGLYWQPWQDAEKPLDEVRNLASSVGIDAEFFCLRTSGVQQCGLAVAGNGYQANMPVATVAVADIFSDRANSIAVFKVDNGWWFLAVRDNLIMPDGDVLYAREEDARKNYMTMMALPDWGRKIVPDSWQINSTDDGDLAKILNRAPRPPRLVKLGSPHGKKLLIIVAVLVLIFVYVGYTVIKKMTGPKQPQQVVRPLPAPRPAAPAPAPAAPVMPPPWLSMNNPVEILRQCEGGINRLRAVPLPGWTMSEAVCSAQRNNVTSNWTASFGYGSWFMRVVNDIGIPALRPTLNESSVAGTVSYTFSNRVGTMVSDPTLSDIQIRQALADIFRPLRRSGMTLSLSRGSEGSQIDPRNPNAPPQPLYFFVGFTIESSYAPAYWEDFVQAFGGLDLRTVTYDVRTRRWKYEGRIYENR